MMTPEIKVRINQIKSKLCKLYHPLLNEYLTIKFLIYFYLFLLIIKEKLKNSTFIQ